MCCLWFRLVCLKFLQKLQCYQQTLACQKRDLKLQCRFHRPYQILKRIVFVAYELELLATAWIHPIFHVGLLCHYKGLVPLAPSFFPPLLLPEEECDVLPQPPLLFNSSNFHPDIGTSTLSLCITQLANAYSCMISLQWTQVNLYSVQLTLFPFRIKTLWGDYW